MCLFARRLETHILCIAQPGAIGWLSISRGFPSSRDPLQAAHPYPFHLPSTRNSFDGAPRAPLISIRGSPPNTMVFNA